MIEWLLIAGIGYVLGSFNFALLVEKATGIEMRKIGTGNYGTMNVFRATKSPFWSLLTLLWDGGKAALSYYIGIYSASLFGISPEWAGITAALFAIAGHNHSFLLEFKSGRGIASFLGASLFINPLLTIFWLLNWVPGYLVTGIMSVGQILASLYMPVFAFLFGLPTWQLAFAVVSGLLMIEGHWEKLKAIRSGEEPRNYWTIEKKRKVEYG